MISPVSRLDKSSTSLTSSSKCSPAARMCCNCSRGSPRSARDESVSNSCAKPITACSGVRNSWLMRARNCDLARLSRCASTRSCSACSASRACCDVPVDADATHLLAVGIEDRDRTRGQPVPAAIGPAHAELAAGRALLARRRLVFALHGRQVVGMHQRLELLFRQRRGPRFEAAQPPHLLVPDRAPRARRAPRRPGPPRAQPAQRARGRRAEPDAPHAAR